MRLMFDFMDSLGRVLFRPSGPALAPRDPGPFYWDLMYLDENGALRRSTIRVIALHADSRRMTVWSDALGGECILKISKIVEASDLQTGRKVNLHRWIANHQGVGSV